MTAMPSFNFNIILLFGLILIAGIVAGKIANLLKLPKITGYIVAGVLLEPAIFGVIPQRFIDHSTVISNFALCIITYAIGGSLFFKKIRKLGNTIWVMTVFEATITFILIAVGLYFALPLLSRFGVVTVQAALFLPLAVLAGSLGCPTDPTPTLAVKEEYKAEGPVTTTILGIGALDDAMGIIIFSISMTTCAVLLGGKGQGLGITLVGAFAQIFCSVAWGCICALVLLFLGRRVKESGVMIVVILGALFVCFGVAQGFNLDELLSTMTMGCIVVNLAKDKDKFFAAIRDYLEEMVFVVFFVVAGAQLEIGVLKNSIWIVLVFVIFRVLGKVLGSYVGAVVSKAQPVVKKYTAFGLIPQGGVVVGLALLIKQDPVFAPISAILLNIVLGTTVLFEFIGPLFTEVALKKAKEVGKETSVYAQHVKRQTQA